MVSMFVWSETMYQDYDQSAQFTATIQHCELIVALQDCSGF